MRSEPVKWDRKEFFKARMEKRSDSVCSDDSRELIRCGLSLSRKRPVEECGVLPTGDLPQFRTKLCCLPICDEIGNINSGVLGSSKDLKLDCSSNLLGEKSCNASLSGPGHESPSLSEGIAFEGDMNQKSTDGLQHSSYQGHSDNSVALAHNPSRWLRSESLSSHESGLSYSISSKSMSLDFATSRVEARKQNMNSCRSASGDTISCVTPTTPSEGTSPWKRPRLKWGEGLAKFEKKYLDPDGRHTKSETIICTSAQLSDCASPSTPSSGLCSSSPGPKDNPFTKAVEVSSVYDSSNSLVFDRLKHLDGFPFNLEKFNSSILIDAAPSLIEMINTDKQCSENSGCSSSSILNKLRIFKSELLKAVDMTEYEVDLLKKKLKSNNESGHNDRQCLASDSPAIGQVSLGASDMPCRPALLLHENAEMVVLNVPVGNGNPEVVKADVDSLRRVILKPTERSSSKPHAAIGMLEDSENEFDLDASHPSQVVQKSSKITSHSGKMINGAVVSNNGSIFTSDSGCQMAVDESLIDTIWASNWEYANRASEDLNIVCPVAETVQGSTGDAHSKKLFLRELIVRKKKALRFKEQAVALKWRAIYSIWKDEMRLYSVQSQCSKAQKKSEISSRTTLNNRLSVRSKTLHVKKSSLDIGKLLSTSQLKPCKSLLKMPALIIDDNEKRTCIFLSSNGLVEDPCAAEKERSMINAWTLEERDIFLDKFASYGKDFRKIASFLDHKTTADCVQFYYKIHKSESFAKIIKKPDRRMPVKSLSNSKYLVAPMKKWDRTMDTASLDILGAVSELVARNNERNENKKRRTRGLLLRNDCARPPQKNVIFPDKTSDFRCSDHEFETLENESEAISSCITSSFNQGEGQANKTPKTFSVIGKPPSISEDILIDDEETCSDESSCEMHVDYWSNKEKSLFVHAVQSYGKDFCMVSRCVATKSKDQCKSFYSKAHKCLGLDIFHLDNDHEQQPLIKISNGDEIPPVLDSTCEAVSNIGGGKVRQRIDENMPLNVSATTVNTVDSLSPVAGMTSHACHGQLKPKGGRVEMPCADLKVECQLVDKCVSNHHLVCVGNKPTMSNDADKLAFLSKYPESPSKSVDVSPSLSVSVDVPYFGSLSQFGTERGSMEPPLLRSHIKENTTFDNILNKVSCYTEDCGTPKAPCQRSADNQPLIGFSGVPHQMFVSRGSVRGATSQNRLSYRTSCGLPTRHYIAGLPTPEFSFSRHAFGETQRPFQASHYDVNHVMHQTYVPLNQFNISQTFKKRVDNNESAWNLNFEDSTISRGSHSDSENGMPCYASIPRRGFVQKCNGLNTNPLVTDLSYLKQGSHHSGNQTVHSVGPEKQEKLSNFKLFGKVLTPTAPKTNFMEEAKSTQSPLMNSPVDMIPLNPRSIILGSENHPVKSFWDGHLMQSVPMLAGCPIPLSHSIPSSSVLDRQVLQSTAVPIANASPTLESIIDNKPEQKYYASYITNKTTIRSLDSYK